MIRRMADDGIGTRIRNRRQALRLTQEDLAARLGVAKATVSNWETGKHLPQRHQGAVEDVLGISLGENGAADWYDENDPIERGIAELPRLPESRKRKLVADLRAAREEHVPRPQDRPA